MRIEKIITLESVDSTNIYIQRNDLPDNTLVRALSQTAGKGRLGRSFLSPEGGLYFSFIFTPKNKALVTVAAALAVAECIPGSVIKWPNDILINGKKVCGILCAGNSLNGRVIVGIGINVNKAPIEGSCFTGGDAQELFSRVVSSIEKVYTLLDSDPNALLRRYDKLLSTKNVTVRVQSRGNIITGRAQGINELGELVVLEGDKTYCINSGEATIIKE